MKDAKCRGILDARILREEVVILRDVHEGCGPQRVGQVPACSRSGSEALAVATPTTPHTVTANCRAGRGSVGLHRGKMVAPRQQSRVDGDRGLLQDGEGWTPPRLHE